MMMMTAAAAATKSMATDDHDDNEDDDARDRESHSVWIGWKIGQPTLAKRFWGHCCLQCAPKKGHMLLLSCSCCLQLVFALFTRSLVRSLAGKINRTITQTKDSSHDSANVLTDRQTHIPCRVHIIHHQQQQQQHRRNAHTTQCAWFNVLDHIIGTWEWRVPYLYILHIKRFSHGQGCVYVYHLSSFVARFLHIAAAKHFPFRFTVFVCLIHVWP